MVAYSFHVTVQREKNIFCSSFAKENSPLPPPAPLKKKIKKNEEEERKQSG